MATEHNIVFCATDFWGLASPDTCNDAAALVNLNLFPAVIDRLQQGALNTLFLGRLMLNPGAWRPMRAFQQRGRPLIETSNLYYDGNSQGGIEGGMLTALAPDFRHAVLGVTGIDYANVLVQRSTDFAPFGTILYAAYPDQSLHPLLLDLMQQLWDRGDPDGYAEQMTAHPLPGTPSHQVLMQIAYGDHQVSMYAAAIEARTVGASAYRAGARPQHQPLARPQPVLRAARDQELPVQRLGDRDLGQRPRPHIAAAADQHSARGDQDRRPAGSPWRSAGDARGPAADLRFPAAQRDGDQRVRRHPVPQL